MQGVNINSQGSWTGLLSLSFIPSRSPKLHLAVIIHQNLKTCVSLPSRETSTDMIHGPAQKYATST